MPCDLPAGILKHLLLAAFALSLPAAALAQEETGRPASGPPQIDTENVVFDESWVTIGIGAGLSPSYEGSDNYNVFPAPIILGRVEGFDFGARGPGLYVDVIRDGDDRDKKTRLIFGPQFRVRLDRVNDIDDPIVDLLGERDAAVEIGFTSGIEFGQLLNPFDNLTLGLDAGWDIAGAHGGRIISPSIAYSTPLSRAALARFSISADHIDDDYADYYFSIDAAGSLASGLPQFDADAGFKSVSSTLLMGYDLSGNALDGGFGLYLLGSYSRLLGDARNSPVTSIRGSADQFFVAGGVSYTF